jgi:hypothetical protein
MASDGAGAPRRDGPGAAGRGGPRDGLRLEPGPRDPGGRHRDASAADPQRPLAQRAEHLQPHRPARGQPRPALRRRSGKSAPAAARYRGLGLGRSAPAVRGRRGLLPPRGADRQALLPPGRRRVCLDVPVPGGPVRGPESLRPALPTRGQPVQPRSHRRAAVEGGREGRPARRPLRAALRRADRRVRPGPAPVAGPRHDHLHPRGRIPGARPPGLLSRAGGGGGAGPGRAPPPRGSGRPSPRRSLPCPANRRTTCCFPSSRSE